MPSSISPSRQFQSTPPHGRRLGSRGPEIRPWTCFNPRLRTGGDVPWLTARPALSKFQSTPPHGRRRLASSLHDPHRVVSIHASAREATPQHRLPAVEGDVSIHASAREATGLLPTMAMTGAGFQSTPPHGRRRGQGRRCFLCQACFNPRLRTGGDQHSCSKCLQGRNCFNPRLRTGGDVAVEAKCDDLPIVSIHASAREATGLFVRLIYGIACFNPRLRTGGDLYFRMRTSLSKSFNPRLRTGGDCRRLCQFCARRRVSIHASAREATIGQRLVRSGPARFNPRLRTGGDDRGLATVASCEQFQSTPPHGRRPLPR